MKRAIDIVVGVLLFVSGVMAAWGCLQWLLTLRYFITHPWWFWSVALAGTVAAVCAVALLRWRRPFAMFGVLAEFILGILLFQFDYSWAAVALLIGGLVWWRFVWGISVAASHIEV